jgi:hypothetical protein
MQNAISRAFLLRQHRRCFLVGEDYLLHWILLVFEVVRVVINVRRQEEFFSPRTMSEQSQGRINAGRNVP